MKPDVAVILRELCGCFAPDFGWTMTDCPAAEQLARRCAFMDRHSRPSRVALTLLAALVFSATARADIAGPFRGLDDLVTHCHQIAIVRLDSPAVFKDGKWQRVDEAIARDGYDPVMMTKATSFSTKAMSRRCV